jgi:enoyl-CoA hydratase/carnithine racemase
LAGVRIEKNGPLAVLRLDKGRGNAIDEPLAHELLDAARQLAKDDSLRGILLASSNPKLFSPGLDLVTLSEYDRPSMERFMGVFAEVVWALYELPKPVVCAVNGHAVAGGCILALTADYRVLRRGGFQMGLNEVKVGVPLPWSIALLLRATVAPAALGQVALLGRNFADDDALKAGLADELADGEGFEDHCLARLQEFAEKHPLAVGITKIYLRAAVAMQMKSQEKDRMGEWLDAWFSNDTRNRIRDIVAGLGKGR